GVPTLALVVTDADPEGDEGRPEGRHGSAGAPRAAGGVWGAMSGPPIWDNVHHLRVGHIAEVLAALRCPRSSWAPRSCSGGGRPACPPSGWRLRRRWKRARPSPRAGS